MALNPYTFVRKGTPRPQPVATLTGATDAILISIGDIFVINRSGGVNATTLADPDVFKDDNRIIFVVNGATQANTITLAGGLGGSALTLITFDNNLSANVTLRARGGKWYIAGSSGATAS